MNVLFLNHKKKQCGVYQYGLRIYNILKLTKDINYEYYELDCVEEYNYITSKNNYYAIIYNYHVATMSWLNKNNIRKDILSVAIPHEISVSFFNITCDIDPDAVETNIHYPLPRPIFENIEEILSNINYSSEENKNFINLHTNENLHIFGSFGFGFEFKGFDKIVKLINDNYDDAVIKFIIPTADFCNSSNENNKNLSSKCLSLNIKPGIKLLISHAFFSNEEILKFLSLNTMNIFLYDKLDGRGISSAIDYAISVKKPIGISDSYMFRNIYSNEVSIYETTIENCMKNSVNYCNKYLEKYSNKNLRNKFKNILKL
jgi:hypothetical protein